jgi:hypothetical protein
MVWDKRHRKKGFLNKWWTILMVNNMLVFVSMLICNGVGAAHDPSLLAGQDLHLTAPLILSSPAPMSGWDQALLMDEGVTVQIGDNRLTSRSAVVWLQRQGGEQADFGTGISYLARVYLEGTVSVQQGRKAKATPIMHYDVTGAEVLIAQFRVTGEVFAQTSEKTQIPPELLTDYDLYNRALKAARTIPTGPALKASAMVPEPARVIASPADTYKEPPAMSPAVARQLAPVMEPGQAVPESEPEPVETFPVHLSAAWEPVPLIERQTLPDGSQIITASGRFYLWHKIAANDGMSETMIEFMADSLVLFLGKEEFDLETNPQGSQIGSGQVEAVYLSGNIVMTEGPRTTRADEIYYDFVNQRALVVNASMRMYDEGRGIPVYLRAEQLSRVSKDIFEAKNVTLTNSEFYFPQMSLTASKMVLLTGEALQQHRALTQAEEPDTDAEARMYEVTAKIGRFPFFKWNRFRTDFAQPDIPLSRIRFGSDSEFGTSIETRWHLFRLLGMKEPDWMKARLAADYFGKRGPGGGVEAEWETDNAFGEMIGYVIDDHGSDDLGRTPNRRNLEPDRDVRGRFSFRNRHFLPDNWQLTTEVSYLSDRNFLEWMYRSEFYSDKDQETLVHLKKIQDNWGFSILGKVRINDFENTVEQLPSLEYHRTGQSFWDDHLTFYSHSQLARFRSRYDDDAVALGLQQTSEFYTFAATRNEVDLPLELNTIKLVPFVAGSYGYEDHYGFQTALDGTQIGREDNVFLGEAGLRGSTMFWKEDPFVRSDFWDVRGIRHIVTPYFETVAYQASDSAADMRDVVHIGMLQRWQTHRGSEENPRTLDWMRLNLAATWVSNDADSSIGPGDIFNSNTMIYRDPSMIGPFRTYGPAEFVFNDPSIPLLLRRNDSFYGMVRDTATGDFVWRLSDTMTVLSDMNVDINSSRVQQFNVGVSRYVYPDISYYIGSRYLRPVLIRVDEDDDGNVDINEEGSHSFVTAITYRISPRYAVSFSQEYNFDFGKSIRSDFALIRQYHRLFYALTFSLDQSLKRNTVMISIWPQGVDELAVGSRKYTGLTGQVIED